MTRTKNKLKVIQCDSERLKKLFTLTLDHYVFESVKEIRFEQHPLKGSTMQAQPVATVGSVFRGPHIYRIRFALRVRGSDSLFIEELPDDVIMGWFAHELGHVVDYSRHSFLGMIGFGLRYLLSTSFRKKIEHRADQIAIEHGFHAEILATKKFLFTHDLIDDKYRNKMKKYYMPLKTVEDWIEENVSIDPVD
ncbi:MAG: hypothetical protein ACQERC_12310 [Bacteroidota bacterium]